MDRRNALKNIAIVSGGLITLPQWMVSCGISDKPVHYSSFTATEQKILANVVDTIIPAGSSIGALSVGVDKFLQKLIDDCYERDVLNNVKLQLHIVEEEASSSYKKSFADCGQAEREKILSGFSSSENKKKKDFFDLMKSETIRGFNTSQKVMTEYLGYKIAPGHYFGCIDVNANDHA
jgi:hypothetical protein